MVPAAAPRLLALCECGQPHESGGELWPSSGCDICSKVSDDGGASWSPLRVVIKNSSQPSPVYDAARGAVVLNFNGAPHCAGCGFHQAMARHDGGETWGAPRALDGFLGDKGHAAAGPGRGLALTMGLHRGRLLFIGHRGAYVEDSVWFTDDGGLTYGTSSALLEKMDEAQLVENQDGLLIANMRHHDAPTKGRAIATSTDGGATFSNITYDPTLVSPVCQASIIRSAQNSQIYFANRATTNSRAVGKVRRSPTGLPGSWEATLNVTDGSFAYSCLTDVPQSGMLGLLWERSGSIVFSTFPLDF